MNLVNFHPQNIKSGYLVSTAPHTVLYKSFWNFAHVFSMVWRCACAFHIILTVIFVTFLYFLNFVIFWPQMYRQWVPCDCNFSYNFKLVFLKVCTCFLPGLQKCTWFGYDFYAPAYSKNSRWALSITLVRPVRLSVHLSVHLSVRSSVRPYVPLRVRAITPKPYGIYSWNFTGAYITLRRCVMNKEDNSCIFGFWIISALLSSI